MFLVVLGSFLGLMTLYVWFRTVRSTTRPGRVRRILTVLLLILTALLVAALVPAIARMRGQRRSGIA